MLLLLRGAVKTTLSNNDSSNPNTKTVRVEPTSLSELSLQSILCYRESITPHFPLFTILLLPKFTFCTLSLTEKHPQSADSGVLFPFITALCSTPLNNCNSSELCAFSLSYRRLCLPHT